MWLLKYLYEICISDKILLFILSLLIFTYGAGFLLGKILGISNNFNDLLNKLNILKKSIFVLSSNNQNMLDWDSTMRSIYVEMDKNISE